MTKKTFLDASKSLLVLAACVIVPLGTAKLVDAFPMIAAAAFVSVSWLALFLGFRNS